MSAYYNEIDPYAAQWLRNLIAAGLIAPGDVDERSIVEIKPDELSGYTQCHFFAGIGVWSHALRSAGWPDSRPVWTGSCPCQPFSGAGKGDGAADPRHLWPAWFKLIDERRPVVCFGEQVASADGLAWLDLVHADLEKAGYAVGALDLCAAGAGAPHIRQRLYFVADAGQPFIQRRVAAGGAFQSGGSRQHAGGVCAALPLVNTDGNERGTVARRTNAGPDGRGHFSRGGGIVDRQLADAVKLGRGRRGNGHSLRQGEQIDSETETSRPSAAGPWSDAIWLDCRDGKRRPAPPEPEFQPLAYGASARVGRLRAYGNAIVAPLAAEFIGAYMGAAP